MGNLRRHGRQQLPETSTIFVFTVSREGDELESMVVTPVNVLNEQNCASNALAGMASLNTIMSDYLLCFRIQ